MEGRVGWRDVDTGQGRVRLRRKYGGGGEGGGQSKFLAISIYDKRWN